MVWGGAAFGRDINFNDECLMCESHKKCRVCSAHQNSKWK